MSVSGGVSQPGLVLLAGLLALAGMAVSWNTRYRLTAFWGSLALVGQAAQLQLVAAGPVVRYQHFEVAAIGADRLHAGLGVVLLLEIVLTAIGLWRMRGAIRGWLDCRLAGWRLPALLICMALGSAVPSREPAAWALEIGVVTLLQLASLGAILLAVCHLPPKPAVALAGEGESGPDRLIPLLAVLVFLIAAFLSVAVYQRHPHVPDEVGFLVQAKYFAAGKLMLPAPPVAGAFTPDLMTLRDSVVYSSLPPGWPAILAIGSLAHAPWLVNPILGALNVVLVYLLIARLYDRRTARLATILFAFAPWNLFLAMSFMGHAFALACALLGALAIDAARQRHGLVLTAAAGLAVGVLTLARPLDGLIVGFLLGLWAIGFGGRRLPISRIAVYVAVAGVVTAGNLAYNKALTGNPAIFPVNEYFDKYYTKGGNDLGFGPNRGLGWSGLDPFPGHGARDVVINSALNVAGINSDFLGWATGSLVLPLLLLFAGKLRRADVAMLTVIVVIVVAHAFYWFSGGPDFGARYWYLAVVPLVALSARAIQELATSTEGTATGRRAPVGAFLLTAFALLTFVPWRALDKYYHYRGMRPDIRALARSEGFGNGLVLIEGKRHPDLASAAVYNPLDTATPEPLYAWDRSIETRDSLFRSFPGRMVWILDGPSVTGAGYRVQEGPCRPVNKSAGEWELDCRSRSSQ